MDGLLVSYCDIYREHIQAVAGRVSDDFHMDGQVDHSIADPSRDATALENGPEKSPEN